MPCSVGVLCLASESSELFPFSVQFSSVAQSCPTPCDPMNRSTSGLPVHHQLPEFTQTHIHRVSDAIQPSHPVVPFSSCPQSLPASGSFPMSQLCMRWPKYWSFSFSIIPSKEHLGLISFRMDWLDLLAVQGTLRSLLQHHRFHIFPKHPAYPCLSLYCIVYLSCFHTLLKSPA